MGNGSITARVVVFSKEDKEVLLYQREDFRIWSLPGGQIESGESWEEAGIREVYEETGYQIAVDRLVGEYSWPQMSGSGDVSYVCLGRVVGGEPIERGPETLKVKWFPLDDLPSRLLHFHVEYIRDTKANVPGPLKKMQRIPMWQIILIRALLWLRGVRNHWRRDN